VAKSQSLFNDPAEKFQELVVLIKQDIQFLDKKIKELENLVRNQRYANEQSGSHSEAIVEALKSNLVMTTNSFKKVLEIRTEVITFSQIRLFSNDRCFKMSLELESESSTRTS
jgi:hypothetical protein